MGVSTIRDRNEELSNTDDFISFLEEYDRKNYELQERFANQEVLRIKAIEQIMDELV